jgi:ferrochelatase
MTGVVLLNMGGPDSLEAVRPFLYNIFSDRDIIRLGPAFLQKPIASLISAYRAGYSRYIYDQIGGRSPLTAITQAQAAALQAELRSTAAAQTPGAFRVVAGMRYWRPYIGDSVKGLAAEGAEELIGLSLYPQYSRASTGPAMKAFRSAADEVGVKYRCIESWHDHPLYIDALTERITGGMDSFAGKPVVLFSAHSLPRKFIDEGDPYLEQTMATIKALDERIRMSWRLAFQSRSGPVKWLGPSTKDTLAALAAEGTKDVLIVPISFVSDHIETLYEIDVLYTELAAGLGLNLRRSASLNTFGPFIRCLADLVVSSS